MEWFDWLDWLEWLERLGKLAGSMGLNGLVGVDREVELDGLGWGGDWRPCGTSSPWVDGWDDICWLSSRLVGERDEAGSGLEAEPELSGEFKLGLGLEASIPRDTPLDERSPGLDSVRGMETC